MSMIGPVVYALIVLVVAGIVHITSILALPWLAARDGFHRLNSLAADNRMLPVSEVQVRDTLPFADPSTAIATCRYVLDRGPVRIRVAVGPTPVTLMLIRRGAGIFHSVSDRAATQGVLEVVVATSDQMEAIAELDSDDEPVQEIRVVSPDDSGLVLLRGLVPTGSQRADVMAVISAATCEAESLDRGP